MSDFANFVKSGWSDLNEFFICISTLKPKCLKYEVSRGVHIQMSNGIFLWLETPQLSFSEHFILYLQKVKFLD